jgi:hypothetical protein
LTQKIGSSLCSWLLPVSSACTEHTFTGLDALNMYVQNQHFSRTRRAPRMERDDHHAAGDTLHPTCHGALKSYRPEPLSQACSARKMCFCQCGQIAEWSYRGIIVQCVLGVETCGTDLPSFYGKQLRMHLPKSSCCRRSQECKYASSPRTLLIYSCLGLVRRSMPHCGGSLEHTDALWSDNTDELMGDGRLHDLQCYMLCSL